MACRLLTFIVVIGVFKVWQNRRNDDRSCDELTKAPANVALHIVATALKLPPAILYSRRPARLSVNRTMRQLFFQYFY